MQSNCFKQSLGLLFWVLLLTATLPTTAKETPKPPKKEIQRIEKKEQAKQARPKFPKESFATRVKRRVKKVGVQTGFISQICGNSTVEGIEECDDGNLLNGDGCSCACAYEPAGPEQCGNNICEVGEDETCWPDCCFELTCSAPPYHEKRCGNCIQEAPLEECDDGNTIAGDGCYQCKDEPVCGDGVLEENEVCDDGNTVNGDQCNNDCTYPRCGDSLVNSWESCDDGNLNNGDGCSALCKAEPAGPNGYETPECSQAAADIASFLGYDAEDFLNLPDCACDDPELTCECETATSQASCNLNGVMEAGEECDDGNGNNDDGCSSDCRRSCQLFAMSCGVSYCNSNHWSKNWVFADRFKLDLLGNLFFVGALSTSRSIFKADACGFLRWGKQLNPAPGEMTFAHATVVAPIGYAYVIFGPNITLKKFDPCGEMVWETTLEDFSPPTYTTYSLTLSGSHVIASAGSSSIPDSEGLIRKYSTATGQLEGTLASWPATTESNEGAPSDLNTGPDGSVYFLLERADMPLTERIHVRKINADGALLSPFGGETDGPAIELLPSQDDRGDDVDDLDVDATGNIYVLNGNLGKKIIKFNPFGFQLQTFSLTGTAWENYGFHDIEIDISGNIYLGGTHRIPSEQQPPEFVPDASGNWGFSETKKAKIFYNRYLAVRKLSPTGEILWTNSIAYSSYAICGPSEESCTSAGIEIGIDGSVHVVTSGGIIKHPSDGATYPL